MNPLPVVEDLDELKDLRVRVRSRRIVPLVDQLIFQRAEEALDDGVVVTAPFAAHAGDQAMRLQQCPV